MNSTTHTACPALSLLLLCSSGIVFAQSAPQEDEDGEVIVIDGRRQTSQEARASEALSEAELVTRIHTAEASEAQTIADLVGNSVGAEVRSVGGLGGFSSVSVRGLGAGHTPVLLDGIPLSRIAAIAGDLSRFDLRGFEAVELYRGAVPAELGASGIGGALNLVSAVGDGSQRGALSAGAGSFGARHLRGRYFGGDGPLAYQLGLGYAGAKGDYMFLNDNGTNLNTRDDTRERRTNNGFDRVDAVVRAREQRGRRIVLGGARVFAKRQGLPGIGSRQTNRATLESTTGVLDSTISDRIGGLQARGQGFAMFDRQRVIDDESEVGLGAGDSTSDTVSAGLTGALDRRTDGTFARLSLVLDSRGDWFRQRGASGQGGMRGSAGATLEGRIALSRRTALMPQARLTVLRTTTDELAMSARTDVDVSPRLAAISRLTNSLTFKASAGYSVRQPTIVEMFGDRGFLAGNPEIRAERGLSADAGLVFAPLPSRHVSEALFEIAGFAARPTDAIVYAPSAAGVARPFNVDGARLAGLELSANARVARLVRMTANYTFLSAVQRSMSDALDGNALPNRARHQGYVNISVERGPVAVWSDLAVSSGNYTDQANIIELPSRAFLGAGLRFKLTETFSITGEGKNLANNIVESIELDPAPRPDLTRVPRPVSDFFGYPLPGRAFYVSVSAAL